VSWKPGMHRMRELLASRPVQPLVYAQLSPRTPDGLASMAIFLMQAPFFQGSGAGTFESHVEASGGRHRVPKFFEA